MEFISTHLRNTSRIIDELDVEKVSSLIRELKELKNRKGRLFILGVGGSAANASHAVNDFRKLAGIESYAPTDNIAEVTARTNDEGWETIFSGWLENSHLTEKDALLILSVGGGNKEKGVSVNLCNAIDVATQSNVKIYSIVGKNDGYAQTHSDVCIKIPIVDETMITPHSESVQAVIWHLIVSHPSLKANPTKW